MAGGSRARSQGAGQWMDESQESDATRWYVPAQQLAAGLIRLGERQCPSDRVRPTSTMSAPLESP